MLMNGMPPGVAMAESVVIAAATVVGENETSIKQEAPAARVCRCTRPQ